MANWNILKNAISTAVRENGNQEITGELLQQTLLSIVNGIGRLATFAGIAKPSTNPGTPDGPVFYIAATKGIYHNFGKAVVSNEAVVLCWTNNVWQVQSLGLSLPYVTTKQGYAWVYPIDNPAYVFYTLSQIPSTNEQVYNEDGYIADTITHVGQDSSAYIIISEFSYQLRRKSSLDRPITVHGESSLLSVAYAYYHEGVMYEEPAHSTVIPGEPNKIYVDLTDGVNAEYVYNSTSGVYERTNNDKADLVDGKVPSEQLPEITGGGGGQIYAEEFGDTLYEALTAILADNTYSGCTIDCTKFSGAQTFDAQIDVNYPCVIKLGDCEITSNTEDNVFKFNSNNIQLIGINRTTDYADTSKASTIIKMTDAAINNDCDRGFHIYSHGNKCITIANINFIGKKSSIGRQCNNSSYPINGYGGLYIEKAKPSTTSSGNTCNATRIENCLISGTKHHGIYLDTGILSEIKDVRMNRVGGHGIYLRGGTTINLQNCYVASGNLAGFCIHGVTYCAVINCVAEETSLGFWVRSSFNVTLYAPGIEVTYPQNTNPWSNSQPISGKYGFNMTAVDDETGVETSIKDVDSDSKGYFIGHGYVVSGGNAINIFSPYAMALQDLSQGGSTHNALRFILLTGNARNINITNARFSDTMGAASTSKHDIELNGNSSEGYPSNVNLLYNPGDSSFDRNHVPYSKAVVYGTSVSSSVSPVFVHTSCKNVSISIGTVYYVKDEVLDISKLTDIDVTELFNEGDITGLNIDADFFSKHRFVVTRQLTTSTIKVPVQVTVEGNMARCSFFYIKGDRFYNNQIVYEYVLADVSTDSLMFNSKGTLTK